MLKYLKKDAESTFSLSDASSDSDVAVVFSYDLSEKIKVIYEICQNMVKIAYDQNNNILVDEYSMDDLTPTDELKEQMFNNAATMITEQLFRFVSDDVMDNETGGFIVEYGTEKTARFPIDSQQSYSKSILVALDKAMDDIMTYGTLAAWFSHVNSVDLVNMANSKLAIAQASFLRELKHLFRRYRFGKVKNYQ